MSITKLNLFEEIAGAKRIGIAGHVSPDGDCIGSCMAIYEYLKTESEVLGIEEIDIYLDPIPNEFRILKNTEVINNSFEVNQTHDVFITLDCGSVDRLGDVQELFSKAKKTINIDHHISNNKFGDVNYVIPTASSTCEVLYGLFEEKRITKQIAENLYVGIVHDTGVFKHSNTTSRTMEVAGNLINKE